MTWTVLFLCIYILNHGVFAANPLKVIIDVQFTVQHVQFFLFDLILTRDGRWNILKFSFCQS